MKALSVTCLALLSLALLVSGDDDFATLDEALLAEVQSHENPCAEHKCLSGQECVVDPETAEPMCVCIRECPENKDERRQVCSNYNSTFVSDCHLLKRRCDCVEGNLKGCSEEEKHLHIDYYGACKEMEPCRAEVLEDFPRRMREWLDNIISRYAEYKKLGREYMTHKWVDAIIWKFCDLDREPHDRHVSRHELFPLRAPLLSMESCIGPFLDSCDADDDHRITLLEWGNCLGADQSEMEDKCAQYASITNKNSVILD